mmetsp:Transcript_7444/g.13451  ORF Transcript_7444/g.13451 Transcript_7444/m.13451 type:complete len:152 (-) Transcript_7444:2580-3035(-)
MDRIGFVFGSSGFHVNHPSFYIVCNSKKCLPKLNLQNSFGKHRSANQVHIGVQMKSTDENGLASDKNITDRSIAQIYKDAQTVYSQTKPKWCQLYTIIPTGITISGGSFTIFHGWWTILAVLSTSAVLVWWFLFLVIYPYAVLNQNSDQNQ